MGGRSGSSGPSPQNPVGAQRRGRGQSGVPTPDRREKPGLWCKGRRSRGLLHIPGGEPSTPSKRSRTPLPARPRVAQGQPSASSAETSRLDGLPPWHVPRRPGGPGSFKRKMNVSYQQLEEIIQIGILFHYLLILVSQSPAFDFLSSPGILRRLHGKPGPPSKA